MQLGPTKTFDEQVTQLTSSVSGPIAEMDFVSQSLLFSELSILAYCQPGFAVQWATKMGFPSVTRTFDDSSDCVAYVFINEHDVVIAFRGVDMRSLGNLDEVLDLELVSDEPGLGKVNEGFKRALRSVWPVMEPTVNLFAPNRGVWACGHSMGGAMALLLAGQTCDGRCRFKIDSIFTFGMPRTGTLEFVNSVTTQHHRWVNHLDIVALVPLWFWRGGYWHHGRKHYIASDGRVEENLIGRTWHSIISFFAKWLKHSFDDHSIFAYREHFVRSQQEGANG